MPKAGVTDDITIATAGGSAQGFMLERNNKGVRGYEIGDTRTLVPRVITEGELTEAEFPADITFYWSEKCWCRGLGGENYVDDRDKVRRLFKMEVSDHGKVRLAPELTATTDDSAPTAYIPSGFAIVGSEVWSFQERDVYSHTWGSDQWTKGTAPYPLLVLYRNGVALGGDTFAPSWVQDASTTDFPEATPNSVSYSADDPCFWIWKADADSNWQKHASQLDGVVSRTCPKFITKVRNGLGNEVMVGGFFNVWAVADYGTPITLAQAINSTQGPEGTWIDVSGDGISANDVVVINNEIMQVENVRTAGGGGSAITFYDRGMLGTTGAAHSNGDEIRQLTVSSRNVHQIRVSTDMTGENWGGGINIGNSSEPITGLVTSENGYILYILKTNGVWEYNGITGSVANLTPEFEAEAHPDNFRGAHGWNGRVLLPLGAGGLMELVNGQLNNISFNQPGRAPEEDYLHGRVLALASNTTQVFALVQDTNTLTAHLLMAEYKSVHGGTPDYIWSHMGLVAYTTGTTEEYWTLKAEGIPSGSTVHKRLWVGVHSSGSNLTPYYLPLETDTAEGFTNDGTGTTHDSGATINDSGGISASDTTVTVSDGTKFREYMVIKIESEFLTISAISGNDLTIQRGMLGSTAATHADTTAISVVDIPQVHFADWDGRLPRVGKTLASADFETANLGAGGRQFTWQWRVDRGAWQENLADSSSNADGVNDVSPNQTMTFPIATNGKILEVRAFPALTTVGTTGPELTLFRFTTQLRPDSVKRLPVAVRLAKQRRLNGGIGGKPRADLAQLRTWAGQDDEVTVVDAEGTSRDMVFQPGTFSVQQITHEVNRHPEYSARFILIEV